MTTIGEMEANEVKLNKMFDQLELITSQEDQALAVEALALWKTAAMKETTGVGPMSAIYEYHRAYEIFKNLGLDVGGMVEPTEEL